jgi:hypothetical protein
MSETYRLHSATNPDVAPMLDGRRSRDEASLDMSWFAAASVPRRPTTPAAADEMGVRAMDRTKDDGGTAT